MNGASINLKPSQGLGNSLSGLSMSAIIGGILTVLLIVAALIFFFMLLLGGIKYITSGGDKGQTETARSQITSALVGLVIVFSAWAIVSLVGTFFGVDIFNLTVPSVQDTGDTGMLLKFLLG